MALFFLVIYFIVIAAVIEIHVILFRLTDLKLEVSRFQVISLMTGTGFTTGESELILSHPIRRKLAIFLISFGAVSLAVIISSISNFLSNNINMKEILYIAGGAIVTLGLLKLPFFQKKLSKFFTRSLKRNVELADLPIRDVFLTEEEDDLLNLHIYKESSLVSKTINQVLTEHDQLELVVLFIKRGETKIRKNLYDTEIHEGDQILLFGNKEIMKEKFENDIKIMEEKLNKQNHIPIDEHSVNNKKSP